jgi:predicted dehydrogenase
MMSPLPPDSIEPLSSNPFGADRSRREFVKSTARVAAVSALAGVALPPVHAAGSDEVRLALVGCGGRGSGAAANALGTSNQGPIRLVAAADVFEDKMTKSLDSLKGKYADAVDVPDDRRFIGFDGFQKAMDTLKPGDIAILTTPPAFRWVQFKYAIERGLNVFMEKPVTVDGPTTRRMLALNEEAKKKNLKVAVGLMCRHCKARQALVERIKGGDIGDITMMRAYRQQGPVATCFSKRRPEGENELMWQIRRFHSFLWLSGGAFSDFFIHNIDECCMIKGAWPVEAKASGGRHFREDFVDQNFDSYAVEYTFDDGTKLFLNGRNVQGAHDEFASYAHGTKGLAVISKAGHSPAKCRTFRGHREKSDSVIWSAEQPEPNPYQVEWDELIEAIRKDIPYNEVERGAIASLVTSMGRYAAHTGQVVTYEEMLNHEHEFAPEVDKLVMNGPAPLQADAAGKYPWPRPGLSKKREY